jgi:DNA-binding transcriptional regulator of glucitol operon
VKAVAGRYRFAAAPKWWVGHVLVVAAVITMIFLGRWQLHVSDRKHFALQNFGYAIQWWMFSVFAVIMWLKILRDSARVREAGPSTASPQPSAQNEAGIAPVEYRRYTPPKQAQVDDPETAAYNAYLAQLAERDRK